MYRLRQLARLEDLIGVEVRDLHLGRRRQEQIVVGDVIGPDGDLELEQSASNFGSWPVPRSDARRTTAGGHTSS